MNPVIIEARTNIKIMLKLGWRNEGMISALRKGYGDNSLKNLVIYKWITDFKGGFCEEKKMMLFEI